MDVADEPEEIKGEDVPEDGSGEGGRDDLQDSADEKMVGKTDAEGEQCDGGGERAAEWLARRR